METSAYGARAPADAVALPTPLPPVVPHSTPAAVTPVAEPEESAKTADSNAQRQGTLTLEELAETIRQVNQTFDLFEISAEFSIDEQDNEVRIVLRNRHTGEVIRRIPPGEFEGNFATFKDGIGLLFNRIF